MKTKSFFTIFVGMAVASFVLAFMVLKLGWFTPGATAKGQFVDHEITLGLIELSDRPMWRLVFQPDQNNCDEKCEEQLYGLNQTYIALGKLQKRVDALVLNESLDFPQYPLLKRQQVTNSELDREHIYLVDPYGKVIMQYAGSVLREDTIKTSKDILADLKKLLNYARVG
jgi:hypothetical protein